MHTQGFAQKCTTIACTFALAAAGAFGPASTAFASEPSEREALEQQANSMTQKIEEATTAYQEATAQVQSLQEMIEENEARSAEIEEQLPAQRERAATSIKAMYLLQQSAPNLLGLILSSESFNDFITTMTYIDNIHERNTNEINALSSLTNELNSTREELALEYETAEQLENEALNALEEARAIKRSLQQRANEIAAAEEKARAEAVAAAQKAVEEAQKAAEEKAAQEQAAQAAQAEEEQAEEEEQEASSSEATFTTSSGNTATIEVPEDTSASTEPLTTNTTSDETSSWAARIDAYLAGSPLAGYGTTFANAAAQYGVDPRFSPAISCIESSKGAICFLPHNAWGWGSSSWSSWEEAIYDHVAGLASMYGGTLTIEGAMMYCPPTYQEWYSSVLAEMNSI